MKKVLSLMMMATIVSCGSKNNSSNDYGVLITDTNQINSTLDSDYDGIEDKLEISRGSDPFTADYPRIKYIVDKIEITNKYFDKTYNLKITKNGLSEYARLKKLISKYAYERVFNQNDDLLVTDLDELETNEVQCFTKFEQKRINKFNTSDLEFQSQQINFFYKVALSNYSFTKKIYDIKSSFGNRKFLIGEKLFEMMTEYKEKFQFSNIYDEKVDYEKENCFKIQNDDYYFVSEDKTINMNDIKPNIKQHLAHILIVTPKRHYLLNVDPKHHNLESILKKYKLDVTFGASKNIIQIDKDSNDFEISENIDLTKDKNLDLGRWFFNSSNGSKSYEDFLPGEYYSLGYFTVGDLLKHTNKIQQMELDTQKDKRFSFNIENLQAGDRIDIELEYKDSIQIPSVFKSLTPGYFVQNTPFGLIIKSIPNSCLKEVYNEIDEDLFEQLESRVLIVSDFYIKASDRVLIPTKNKSSLNYTMYVKEKSLMEGEIRINLESELNNPIEFIRHSIEKDLNTKQRCKKNNEITNIHHKKKLKLSRKLQYKGTISVFGPIR